jgi:diguanylate cyclase (GGDEF)-like protein
MRGAVEVPTKRGRARDRHMAELGRGAVLLAGIWILGLIAIGAVVGFGRRVDQSRQAQVVIAQLRNEGNALVQIAFNPATSGKTHTPLPAETAKQLAQAKRAIDASLATLSGLGTSDRPARIELLTERNYRFVDHVSALVAGGHSQEAALLLGRSNRPGGVEAQLNAELGAADTRYGAAAAESRTVASIGTVVSILSLLVAFSVVFYDLVRARRRSHQDATTDALTALGNRRKLVADMELAIQALGDDEKIAIGIFDLDGFKGYNDTFGHPAGDALLVRLGSRLATVVGGRGGAAYRIGGDEFVVVTNAPDPEPVLSAAESALSEHTDTFAIGCSRGSARIVAGVTFEDALRVADQRLYTNKRSGRGELRSEAKDALLQVLAEQNGDLVTHLGHVARLAERIATGLGLSPELVERTRIAAELHDVGKAAIPASILEKPGPLNAVERSHMERHSVIGTRIVAVAPTLDAIAPIIRAAHERPDGSGYPDGLRLDEIPISARIIAVVDAFDAMTNDRPYRRAMSMADAVEELRRNAGTQFEPRVVDALASAVAIQLAAPQAA